MRRFLLIAFVLSVFGHETVAQEEKRSRLDDYKAIYAKQMQQIEDDYLGSLSLLVDQYRKALTHVAGEMQQAGDLEGWESVRAELKRFDKAGVVAAEDIVGEPGKLRALQTAYSAQRDKVESNRAARLGVLARNYVTALERLKVSLTRDGRMGEAVAVRTEIERVEPEKKEQEIPQGGAADGGERGEETEKGRSDGVPGGVVEEGNVALAARGAKAYAQSYGNQLNDGNARDYGTASGYAHGKIPARFMVVFPKIYRLSKIRILLWDLSDRSYRYKVDVSGDGQSWEQIVDRSKGEWRSWQEIEFGPRPVSQIKVTGLHNTAGKDFHIVEIEAYCEGKENMESPQPKDDGQEGL